MAFSSLVFDRLMSTLLFAGFLFVFCFGTILYTAVWMSTSKEIFCFFDQKLWSMKIKKQYVGKLLLVVTRTDFNQPTVLVKLLLARRIAAQSDGPISNNKLLTNRAVT